LTVIVPFIQLGWMEQSYVYVPGVVRVTVNVWPALIVIGELGALEPLGWVSQWTLCGAPDWLSWSTKVTVLFTPTTSVKLDGWKFSDWSAPTFCGITTVAPLPVGPPLEPLDDDVGGGAILARNLS
jgi:hypothetical protein